MNLNIALICGARPNFMKIRPLQKELKKRGVKHFVVNTGQHFSPSMSLDLIKEFGIEINYHIEPNHDSPIKQFSDIMLGLEKIFVKENPNIVIVVGDINSTFIAALVANKMNVKLVHIEAGLRSYNKLMPEEHNRVLTDHLADLLLTTSEEAQLNLNKEGLTENIYFIGNLMIDTLVDFLPKIKENKENFYFCTLHRAENVDNPDIFKDILDALEVISKDNKIYLPLHPRTEKMAKKFGLFDRMKNIFSLLPALDYQTSLFYQKNAKLVLTDSGGIQEESSYLGVPCLTLRKETERPITVEYGTNKIAGVSKDSILNAYGQIDWQKKNISIPLWDGKAAERAIDILVNKI